MIMNDIAMIAADTSRSRVYVQSLVRNNLLPRFVLVLGNKPNSALPGQINNSDFENNKESTEKGRYHAIKERFLKNGKWKKTLKSLKGNYLSLINTTLTGKNLSLKIENLENLVNQGINLKSEIRLDNYDPGTIEDIDSLEDWCYLNQMFIESKKDKKEGYKLYPYTNLLNKFKKGPMLELKKDLKIYGNFEEHINNLFYNLGLNKNNYYSDGDPFIKELPYKSKKLKLNFVKDYVKIMIKNNLRYHQKYFDKISSNNS